ncbi:hypothetical protein DOTSEDRAFT_72971 [Dothistroma septosporum NZE10]|uniref:Uncharacterized protein n=1 Tax=Dothistroma septosporum (strain NZE10 / CBS 128990) TaxID=675120 RepID=N1PHF5_DOTSN|nr:hypothetical protein DOTSEDRAFT_72971 [Dothistroma septosporum NZE10]
MFLFLCVTSLFWTLVSVLTLWFSEPYSEQVRQDLHNPTLLPATARKCYIFPEHDLMFAWDSPTDDDELCLRQEFHVRRNSIDQKQQWTSNQERYWLGIENAWDGR